ncbi:hypothetical protein FNAPI_123 [Fusarium napiforme]|uniref:Uncharacterized protein n=1 Tax=Fusarium napiforme TaxID=42672 RepID=A0A8H5K9T9_9HYPO|nr:hypothetical protein FNAPI_123 [Fusarium napiforme]
MFRPKQPFEGKEEIEARLTEINHDGLTAISSQCISFARDRPDDFMNYLRHAWKQEGPTLRKDEDLLNALQKVELSLGDDIGLVHDDDGMFYIDLLAALKSGNESGAVEFPRRVLELYLRIQAACDIKGEDALKQMTREWFKDDPVLLTEKGWHRSSECYVEAPEYLSNVITGPILLPSPKSWDVSSFELAALEKFYRETLQVDDGSLDAVLKELDKKPDFHHSKQLYGVLNEIWTKISRDDLPRLREYFKANQCIILSEDDTERYTLGDCIWAPKLDCPKNASKSFPELQTLFVSVLGMKKTNIGLVYHKIVNFIRSVSIFGEPREQKARRLLVALSQDVEDYGSYIDKEKILESDIFPVVERGKHVMLRPASADFYIMDREAFQTEFRGKVPVLDIDHTTFWLLQPFFNWAGLQGRYLMSNIGSIRNAFVPGSVTETPAYIHPMRAKGLLRLAVHYRSPQTRTASGRESLARTLGKTRIHHLKDHSLFTTLKMKDFEGSHVASPLSEVYTCQNDDGLEIYLEKKSAEVATAVQLPLVLARFLMEDPNDESRSEMPVDAMLPGLIRTILRTNNHSLRSIKRILDEEGIVDVDKLENSPYIPANGAGELLELLAMGKGAQRSRDHGSRTNQDPKVTEVHGHEDDLTREFGSLSLQRNTDTTVTVWGSDSTK